MTPPLDRDPGSLAPIFRVPFLAWLTAAEASVPHVEFRITETRRTLARQQWLYAQGREEPYKSLPEATWTLDSNHRWGLAADIAMIRKATGEAIWEIPSWKWLYKTVPLEPFGLRNIAPLEWVHIEYLFLEAAIEKAHDIKLIRT